MIATNIVRDQLNNRRAVKQQHECQSRFFEASSVSVKLKRSSDDKKRPEDYGLDSTKNET